MECVQIRNVILSIFISIRLQSIHHVLWGIQGQPDEN